MEFFNKKPTLIRTICFMAFFVAINVICSLLAVYLPLISVILIIFLPLTSAVVEINCKDRWFPIYALATIGLSIVVTLSQIDFTIFYIVPSIVTGYVFGLISKKNLPDMFAIFIASILQTILTIVFIPLINYLGQTNLLDFIMKILKISDRFWFDTLLLLAVFLLSLIQVVLSYIVVDNELKKLGIKSKDQKDYYQIANCATLLSVFLCIGLSFISLKIALLLEGFAFYFASFIFLDQYRKNEKIMFILDAFSVLITIFAYGFLYKLFANGQDVVLFCITPLLISISSILHYFLKKSM